MLTITQLKGLFKGRDFRPAKRYGENYLIDSNIGDKIIAEAALTSSDTVLEIGPGLGAITAGLASSGAEMYAVEKDRKAFAILKDILSDRFSNLKIIQGDILEFPLDDIRAPIKMIGNLPYYITTPILEYLITNRHKIILAVIMVQREVANRMLAKPGSKDYSSLSCFIQYYTKPKYVYTVKRTSFYPEPDVDSSIVRLDVTERPSVAADDEELLFKVIRGSFNQRRKSVINSLSREEVLDMPKEDLSKLLSAINIDPTIRPEMLSLADFALIANAVYKTK